MLFPFPLGDIFRHMYVIMLDIKRSGIESLTF